MDSCLSYNFQADSYWTETKQARLSIYLLGPCNSLQTDDVYNIPYVAGYVRLSIWIIISTYQKFSCRLILIKMSISKVCNVFSIGLAVPHLAFVAWD